MGIELSGESGRPGTADSAVGLHSTAEREAQFFFAMSVVCAGVAFVGFFPTFWRPLAQGTFHAKPIVYVHGGFFFAWTCVLTIQSWLAMRNRLRTHRAVGMAGISLATLAAVSGLLVTLNVAAEANPAGLLEAVAPDLIFPVVGMPTFALLVILAMVWARRPDLHKRCMLLATISALDAPVARWILFKGHDRAGYSEGMVATLVFEVMLVAVTFYDWRLRRRIHPVYGLGAAILIGGQALRGFLGPSRAWAAAIHGLTAWY